MSPFSLLDVTMAQRDITMTSAWHHRCIAWHHHCAAWRYLRGTRKCFSISCFLCYCLFSRLLRDSMTRYVGSSIRLLVCVSFFWCLRAFSELLLLPNCLKILFHHCPCPPACDFGSCVYGLVSRLNATLKVGWLVDRLVCLSVTQTK